MDYVITYHRRPLDAVDQIKETCVDSFQLAGKTPGFIAFLFLQRCLYDYAHLNLANDNYLDLLEAELAAGSSGGVPASVTVASRNILTLKKLAASLHIVLMLLGTKRSRFVSDDGRNAFLEMLRNALAIREAVDSSRDLLDGILGGVQAAAANRTSEIARVLTVVSSIMLPLTLLAGIYGMNFENMPELKWELGYFGVLGVMAALGLGLVGVFWRLGWLGTGATRGGGRRKGARSG
jgi:magnesium transporter